MLFHSTLPQHWQYFQAKLRNRYLRVWNKCPIYPLNLQIGLCLKNIYEFDHLSGLSTFQSTPPTVYLDEGRVQVDVVWHDDCPHDAHSLLELGCSTALTVGDKHPPQQLTLVWSHRHILEGMNRSAEPKHCTYTLTHAHTPTLTHIHTHRYIRCYNTWQWETGTILFYIIVKVIVSSTFS